MSIRALIADDEPLARQSICRCLKAHSDIRVIEECADGQSTVAAILSLKPDLVFLDVQKPELDGFAVVQQIGTEKIPATIFVTAFDQYALAAFDANALDYLLKPFGKMRFERALNLTHTMHSLGKGTTYIDRLPVAENGRIVFVNTRDIQWIESAGNYAKLHTAARQYAVRDTLVTLEKKLNPRDFVRIHRSTIVNFQFVKEVHPWFHGYHRVLLANGQELRMSRYQQEVAKRLGLSSGGNPSSSESL